jgi:hypothetical protein
MFYFCYPPFYIGRRIRDPRWKNSRIRDKTSRTHNTANDWTRNYYRYGNCRQCLLYNTRTRNLKSLICRKTITNVTEACSRSFSPFSQTQNEIISLWQRQCFESTLGLCGSRSSFFGECGSGSSFGNECGSMWMRIQVIRYVKNIFF